MTYVKLNKETSITSLVEKFSRDLGEDDFLIIDHWESDLCAIGISKKKDEERLVYISTFNRPKGEYYYELEYSSKDKFVSASNKEGVANYCELLKIIKKHLDFSAFNGA